jgi:hypothetical protein
LKVVPPFGPEKFEARYAENKLLTPFYAFGIVGVCLPIGTYGSLYRQIRRLQGPVKVVLFSLLLFVVVRGVDEAEPFDLLLPPMFDCPDQLAGRADEHGGRAYGSPFARQGVRYVRPSAASFRHEPTDRTLDDRE